MSTTEIPNWLLALLVCFASFGAMVLFGVILLGITGCFQKKKATDREYKALYESMIAHAEFSRPHD